MLLRSIYRQLHSGSTYLKDVKFGSLSDSFLKDPILSQDEQQEEEDPTEKHAAKIADVFRPRPGDFLKKIQRHLDASDLRSALEVLQVEMKEECVKPTPEHYRLLIHACGRRGYAKKSLALFKSYKSRGFPISQGLYSDLFNSLYNSPYPVHALKAANSLRHSILSNSIQPNPILANNMIKTFGKVGDLETAFDIADETLPNVDTLNHLLSACLSDKEAGFRHAIVLWRRFVTRTGRWAIAPNAQSFSLLLRIAQECSLGREEHRSDLLLEAMSVKQVQALADGAKRKDPSPEMCEKKDSNNQGVYREDNNLEMMDEESNGMKDNSFPEIVKNEVAISARSPPPHFLQPHIDFEGVSGLSSKLNSPTERFLSIGGVDGFLQSMATYKSSPDVKVFTQMLRLLPHSPEMEDNLLKQMDSDGVEPDIGFFNVLIKRRSRRGDIKGAREDSLREIFRRGLVPEVRTYGILALACHNSHHLHVLVDDMKNNGIRLNNEILGALLSRPAAQFHFKDLVFLLRISRQSNLKISPRILSKLEELSLAFRREVLMYERSDPQADIKRLSFEIKNEFKGWELFQKEYAIWLRKVTMEADGHEWKQYLTSAEENNPSVLNRIVK